MFPVLPLFVDPVPSRPPPQRACDTDRETAVDILCAAVADGRLILAELDKRVETALRARTLTDLARTIADLSPLEPQAPSPVPNRSDNKRESTTRWELLQSLLPAESCPQFA